MGDSDTERMFDKLDKLDANVSAIRAELGAYMARTDERLDHGARHLGDLETRLRAVEMAHWKLAGGALTLGTVSGAIASVVTWALTHH